MEKRRIKKYEIYPVTKNLKLPKGSELLSCANNYDTNKDHFFIYARVDTETKETDEYALKCCSTGDIIEDDYEFLGTIARVRKNDRVYHVFYKKL